MGVETENNEIAAKGFENTDFVDCISVVRVSREILPVGYLKGRYKSESSLMTCVAELHGSVIRMPSSILSHIGNSKTFPLQLEYPPFESNHNIITHIERGTLSPFQSKFSLFKDCSLAAAYLQLERPFST